MTPAEIAKERQGLPGASELHRIMACPGSVFACRNWKLPRPSESAIASDGSKMHEVLEKMEYEIDGTVIEMDLKMAQEWITSNCADIAKRLRVEIFQGQTVETFTEKRLWMTDLNGNKILSGKADRIDRDRKGRWLLVDYKTGPKPVPAASNNWQIHGQALCLEESEAEFDDFNVAEIYGVVIQPLVTLFPQIVKIEPRQLTAVRRQVRDRLMVSNMEGQPRIPGSHCAYCPAQSTCFEAQTVGMIMQKRFSALSQMSPSQVTEVWRKCTDVTRMVEEIKNYIKSSMALNPSAFPELELVSMSNGFVAPDKMKLLALIEDVITREEYRDLMDVRVTDMRELWISRVAERDGITKKAAEAQWKDRIVPALQARPNKQVIKEKKTDGLIA